MSKCKKQKMYTKTQSLILVSGFNSVLRQAHIAPTLTRCFGSPIRGFVGHVKPRLEGRPLVASRKIWLASL